MEMDRKYEDLVKGIDERMSDPKLKKKVNDAVRVIEEIFEAQIDISLVYTIGLEEYKDIYDNYDLDELKKKPKKEVMTVKEFISCFDGESEDLKITMDGIYLKKGLNDINNMYVTTLDDNKIIIAPKPIEK